jgi:hypothetical protein
VGQDQARRQASPAQLGHRTHPGFEAQDDVDAEAVHAQQQPLLGQAREQVHVGGVAHLGRTLTG